MTIMQIPIPDDLKEAFEKAHPGETIEAAVERLLRAEVARTSRVFATQEAAKLFASITALAKGMNLQLTDDQFRTLRHEGRP